MWLEALKPWVVPLNTLESSPIHQQLLNKKNEDFNFPTIKLKATTGEKPSTTKRLKSATKGMFKALREGSKSIVSPLAGLASNMTSNNSDKKDDTRKSINISNSNTQSQWPPQIGTNNDGQRGGGSTDRRGSKSIEQIDIYEYDIENIPQNYNGPLSNLLQELDHIKETLTYFHTIFDSATANADEIFSNSLQLLGIIISSLLLLLLLLYYYYLLL